MILVVDDMAIFREPIAACLRLAGFEAQCASDGNEALALARKKKPELILLDLTMPGMDGMTFLHHLRADRSLADVTVFLLTAISDKAFILQGAKLGIKEYLLKSRFSTSELLARVKKYVQVAAIGDATKARIATAVAPSTVPTSQMTFPPEAPVAARQVAHGDVERLLDKEQCLRQIKETSQTKTLSGVVTQIMTLASSPRGDMGELASLIGRDPMLSARVLAAANSAAYMSTRGVIKTLGEAVRQIGSTTVRNIAAACGIFDVMPNNASDGFNPIYCWQHSFAVAQLCEVLLQPSGPEAAGTGYIVGLCHDLAEILLRVNFDAEYKQIQQTHLATGLPIHELEHRMLGMTRTQLVACTIQSLQLPTVIRAPIEAFHDGSELTPKNGGGVLAALRLAENYANALLLASASDATVSPFSRAECRLLFSDAEPVRPNGEQFRSQTIGLTTMLARLSRAEESQLLKPLFPKLPVRLIYVRDPAFTSFDPIQTALESIADVELRDTVPTIGTGEHFHGVVFMPRKAATLFLDDGLARFVESFPNANKAIMALVPRPETDATTPIAMTQWPVTLERLAHWVQQLPEVGSAARAA